MERFPRRVGIHATYPMCTSAFGVEHEGFTVIRHPKSRLKSAIRFTIHLANINQITLPFNSSDINSICDFYFDNISSLSILQEMLQNVNNKHNSWIRILKEYDSTIAQIPFICHTLMTQTYFAFYPNVKHFRYENLVEFNNWLELNTGREITSRLRHRHKINLSEDDSLNFDVEIFDQLSRTLFVEDYINFGFEPPTF